MATDAKHQSSGRFGLRIGVVLVCIVALGSPARADEAGRSAEIDAAIGHMDRIVTLAERTCLSGSTSVEQSSLRAELKALLRGVTSSVGLERRTTELRGASQKLPALIQQSENDAIRTCMTAQMAPLFAAITASFEQANASAAWPDPIDFRFNFDRTASRDATKYSDFLRLDLRRTMKSPLTRRIVNQTDPSGMPYFQYDVSYPGSNEVIQGTIIPEMKGDARLTAARPSVTKICFMRPAKVPSARAEFDMFDCTEGANCKPSPLSTGWLIPCPNDAALAPAVRHADPAWTRGLNLAALLAPEAQAQEPPDRPAERWVVPSLAALASRKAQGVGYAIFSLQTDAFRDKPVIGVEVALAVNGRPVDEDGLAPELRPVANDPRTPFSYSFGLQTLDFQGAHGGCDHVQVGLTPLLKQGGRGIPLATTLVYVPQRDVAPRQEKAGDYPLTWTASYVVPEREWRHVAFVHSYIYRMAGGTEARDAAVAQAEADKAWLDGLNLTYADQRVVGIVRPPRVVQPNGTAAFGLAIGLVQPSGQIRFTFSEGETRKIGAFMIALRAKDRRARDVVAPEGYVFQAAPGARTVPGVCGEPAKH